MNEKENGAIANGNDHHNRLVRSLSTSDLWGDDIEQVEVIETHISTLFLVGDFAYKMKKPLNLGFLDFSSLEKRHYFCNEEVRLNRRLAPNIYLDVIPISGDVADPQLGGEGEPIEWLVKMQRFNAHAVFSEHPEFLNEALIKRLAHQIADFHLQADVINKTMPYGLMQSVLNPMMENFSQLDSQVSETAILDKLHPLKHWTIQQSEVLQQQLLLRRKVGFVRECHGDLHLGNIVLEQDEPLIFDGIEFAPELRWIDTISDLAFLLMDLSHQRQTRLANALLNFYLEQSGDYGSLPLLSFYLAYRAMVRAKVTAIRFGQTGLDELDRQTVHDECLDYLLLAESFTHAKRGAVVITHGVSGSGKSTVSEALIHLESVVRIRSDVERKRLAGYSATHRVSQEEGEVLYSKEMNLRTYQHLLASVSSIVQSGQVALVDAAFLRRQERVTFTNLATELDVPFRILDFDVEKEELIRRIEQRTARNDDASDANVDVLIKQLQWDEPLDQQECSVSLPASSLTIHELAERIRALQSE